MNVTYTKGWVGEEGAVAAGDILMPPVTATGSVAQNVPLPNGTDDGIQWQVGVGIHEGSCRAEGGGGGARGSLDPETTGRADTSFRSRGEGA